VLMSGTVDLYVDYLMEEGYRPRIDDDGDVVFKHEGRTYYITIDVNDKEFFRLIFPNFWSIENDEERDRAYIAADYATERTKVAKVYMRSDGLDMMASIEMFIADPAGFAAVFPRCLSALQASVKNFREKMNVTAEGTDS
jgi:hypothetical protein